MMSVVAAHACRSTSKPLKHKFIHLAKTRNIFNQLSLNSLASFIDNSLLFQTDSSTKCTNFATHITINSKAAFTITSLQSRKFSSTSTRRAKELSDKGDIVYRGAISGMIRGVKIFSLSTSVIGVCLQPMLIFNSQELPTALKFVVGGFLNFFIFMNPFIIHYIAKRYVTDLRWNPTTGLFTAATWSLFAKRKELQFSAENVKVPDVPGMFTLLEAKGVPLFLEPQAFTDREAYIRLMGFDKPLDWELPPKGSPEPQKESQKG